MLNKINIEEINKLKKKLNHLIKKKKEKKLRIQANIENIKKKSEETIKKIKYDNLNNFLKELSNIINQFDKIFEIPKIKLLKEDSIIKGIKLIQKSLSNTFKKFNIKK